MVMINMMMVMIMMLLATFKGVRCIVYRSEQGLLSNRTGRNLARPGYTMCTKNVEQSISAHSYMARLPQPRNIAQPTSTYPYTPTVLTLESHTDPHTQNHPP